MKTKEAQKALAAIAMLPPDEIKAILSGYGLWDATPAPKAGECEIEHEEATTAKFSYLASKLTKEFGSVYADNLENLFYRLADRTAFLNREIAKVNKEEPGIESAGKIANLKIRLDEAAHWYYRIHGAIEASKAMVFTNERDE